MNYIIEIIKVLIKTQIFIAGGYKLSDKQIKIYSQASLGTNGYAIQSRITTEDPENDFKPDYGMEKADIRNILDNQGYLHNVTFLPKTDKEANKTKSQ